MTSTRDRCGLAKVIVIGEHAVVHGHRALAGALDRRVCCRIVGDSQRLRLRCDAWALDLVASPEHPVGAAALRIASAVGFSRGAQIDIDADIPARAGLGSSAALCVALTRCLAQRSGAALEPSAVEQIANLGEACFHARPSGIDVALAARGGLGLFSKDRGLEPLARGQLSLAIGLSGQERSTAALVEAVSERRRRDRAGTDAVLTELGALAERAAAALEASSGSGLGDMMNRAQALLASLGLSTPTLDQLVERALAAGATGAKLTGAGGGGAVIAVGPDLQAVVDAWRGAGFDGFTSVLGAPS